MSEHNSVHGRRDDPRPTVGFDLDGVLIRNPFETCVLPRLAALVAATPGVEGVPREDVEGAVRVRVAEGWRTRMNAGRMVDAYDWDAIYREVAAHLGGTPELVDAVDVSAWVRECCDDEDHIEALEGAHPTLQGLAEKGARLVVVTNGFAAYQEPVLEALGLLQYFDAVVTPDRAGAAKPAAAIFEAAGGLDLFVGDTLVHDVLGAKAAGIAVAWLTPALPQPLRDLQPWQRATDGRLRDVITASLAASPHSRFHPEADQESCAPDFVIETLPELLAVYERLTQRNLAHSGSFSNCQR